MGWEGVPLVCKAGSSPEAGAGLSLPAQPQVPPQEEPQEGPQGWQGTSFS